MTEGAGTLEAYTSFAEVYDTFMDNVPYQEWADYLEERLKEYGIEDGLVMELGCGTGSMTQILSEKGYDMIGIDNSEDMLELAPGEEEGRRISCIFFRICGSLNFTEPVKTTSYVSCVYDT